MKEFGALVFAATMNVRQICSIIVSYTVYHHALVPLQLFGIGVTFAALFYKSYLGFKDEMAVRQPLRRPELVKEKKEDGLLKLNIQRL